MGFCLSFFFFFFPFSFVVGWFGGFQFCQVQYCRRKLWFCFLFLFFFFFFSINFCLLLLYFHFSYLLCLAVFICSFSLSFSFSLSLSFLFFLLWGVVGCSQFCQLLILLQEGIITCVASDWIWNCVGLAVAFHICHLFTESYKIQINIHASINVLHMLGYTF